VSKRKRREKEKEREKDGRREKGELSSLRAEKGIAGES